MRFDSCHHCFLVLSSHLRWAVCCGYSFSSCPCIDTLHVWTSDSTTRFIMALLFICKTHYSCFNHRLVFSCEPNCTCFTILVACICDPIIYVAFPVIALLHLTPFPTRHLCPFFDSKESIWVTNFHTINEFFIFHLLFYGPCH